MATLNIEDTAELARYLRESGRLEPDETPHFTILKGGVSNRTVLVELRNPAGTAARSFVLKQALPKLRVQADWFSDPSRIHHEALGLKWLARLAPPGAITPLVFEDPSNYVLAMEAVPQPHENWKTVLLAGRLAASHVRQFGELLGSIHRRSRERRDEIAAVFADRTFFETLRIEPYYRYSASRHPSTQTFFDGLIAETEATRETLVHGDYSPKNILVQRGRLVLLDHEVIHFGDPAFDLGFALTHLLSKAHHLASMRAAFLRAASLFWRSYRNAAGPPAGSPRFDARVVRHTLGCLLARVDGRSPLEYFSTATRDRQRAAVLNLIAAPPAVMDQLTRDWASQLASL